MRFSSRYRSLAALAPLVAASVLAAERPAQAILNYYIYETGGNVVLNATGSLSLSSKFGSTIQGCAGLPGGAIFLNAAGVLCTGADLSLYDIYAITGPSSISGLTDVAPADSVAGTSTFLYGALGQFMIDPGYVSGNPISSSATFNGYTLAGLGFTTPGLLASWTLSSSGDTINVVVGAPSAPPPAPGPLPLFGAAAAFSYSRRLRRRVNQVSASASLSGTISA